MPFRITITADVEAQLQTLPVRDQRIVEAALLARLQNAAIQALVAKWKAGPRKPFTGAIASCFASSISCPDYIILHTTQ